MKISVHIFLLSVFLLLLQACEEQPVNLMVPYTPPAPVITIPPVAAPAEVILGLSYSVNIDSVISTSNLTWEKLTYIHTNSLLLKAVDSVQTISVPLDSIRIYMETPSTERVLIGHRYQNSEDSSATILLSPDRNDLQEHFKTDTVQIIFAAIIRKSFTDTLNMYLNMNLYIRAEEKPE